MLKTSRKMSLTQVLVYYFILIGSVIAILTTLSSYSFLSHRSRVQYEKSLEEYLVYLEDSLELPLWRMDKSALEKICRAFLKNDVIGMIRVLNEDGDLLYEAEYSGASELMTGYVTIRHGNEIIGQVVLGLTPSLYIQKNKELLFTGIFMAAMMILGLALSIKIALNILLKKPLDDLIRNIQKIASGDYRQTNQDYKQQEIASISTEFRRMTEQVKSREKSLLDAKKELEERTKELIEERKKLEASEERLEEVIEKSPVAMVIAGPDNKIRRYNKKFVDIFGYTFADFQNFDDWFVMAYPDEEIREAIIEKWYNGILDYFRTGRFNSVVAAVRCKDGSFKDIEFDFEAVENQYITSFLDITERNAARIEAVREKEFSEHIINSMPGIFFMYQYENGRLNLKKWNKNHEALLGFRKNELKNSEIQSFFVKDHIPRINRTVSRIFDKGIGKTEVEIRAKDGSLIPFYLQAMLFENADDTFIMGTGIDITEQKQFENEKQELLVRLAQAQKMEAIGTLAGGIAHDFNNILSSIFGYSQLAQINLDKPLKANDHIGQVMKGAQRATELVQQILTFSRQTEYNKKPFKVYLEVNEALKLLRSTIPSTIEIKTNLNSRTMVLADPTKIHQVIMNLCTNAYHAMSRTGGLLTVSLKDIKIDESKMLRGEKIPMGKYLRLEVSDTGHGMDEKTLEKAFDPYYTTKEAGQGTGLGLALVRAIVDEHDSFLNVSSKPGTGTTFHIYFPSAEKKAVPKTPEMKKSFSLKGNETIMVVDDEETIRQILKEILGTYGYKVQSFQNGAEAFEAFESNADQFDLIITDMTMPEMAGDEFSTKALKTKTDIPIIMCTGFSENISKKSAIELGIKKFIKKPVENLDLLAMIREILDEKQLKKN